MPKPWHAVRYRVGMEILELRGEDEVIEVVAEREERDEWVGIDWCGVDGSSWCSAGVFRGVWDFE